jgi:hypothetical protein
MTRHIFFAITLIGTGLLLNAQAQAVTPLRCEDRAANCVGSCADVTGGAGDLGGRQNKCMRTCEQQVIKCLIRTR